MSEFYLTNEYWFAVIQLVLAMLGMGATLTFKDFREVLIEPKAVTVGCLAQLLLIPLVAYLFVLTFGMTGGVAIGVALIAAIPGGTSSNVFTYLARGNIALSICITGITTLLCLVSTPFFLDLTAGHLMPENFVMPTATIVTEIALTLLLPLLIGMLILNFAPKYAPLVAKFGIRGTLLFLLFIVIGSLSAGRLSLDAFGWTNVGLIVLLMAVFLLSGLLASKVFGLPRADGVAMECEIVVRNVNLGILIKASLFPAVIGQADAVGDMVLFTLLLYGGVQMLFAGGMIAVNRRFNKTAQL